MRISALFDPEPEMWGMRGDPHLWRALSAHLADHEVPASAEELASVLHAAFRELADTDLAKDPASSVYREQYAHGGMSSGMISLDTWRQQLMPMLAERARTRLPSRPRKADRDHTNPLTPW
jgi:hypothetical protein